MINLASEKIITKLTSSYYDPVWTKRLPPMEELIFTVLTQHTSDKNADKAFNSLMSNLKNFETILETKSSEISRLIHMGGLANIKSKRILSILKEIKERTKKLPQFKSKYKKGILAKYAAVVSSASKGILEDVNAS